MNRFLKGAMILTIAGIIVKVIGAFSKVLIARILGGEGIGLYQMAYPIYQMIVSIAVSGIPVAISIMIAEKLANEDMRGIDKTFKVSLMLLTTVGAIFGIGMFVLADYLVEWGIITDPRALLGIKALAPAIFVVTLLSCFRGYFQGFQYMVPTGTSQVFEQTFRVVTMVGLAYLLIDRGLDWAAAGATFATFPGVLAGVVVLGYFYYRQRHVRHELRATQNSESIEESTSTVVKRLIALAIPVSMANIVMPIVMLIDMAIVPRRLMDIGYYMNEATTQFGYLTGMATSLVGLPIILTTSLAASLVPAVSESAALHKLDDINHRSKMAMKIANLFTIPACVGLSVLATPVSQMIYNTPHAGPAIAVMSLSIVLLGAQQITAAILQGLGRTVIPMVTIFIGLLVKVFLDYELTAIPELGINGAAWATNIFFGLAAILNFIFVKRYIGSIVPKVELIKIILSAMAMGGMASVMYSFLLTLVGNALAVGFTIVGAIVTYGATLWLTRAITRGDLYNMPIIGKRLLAKKRQEEVELYDEEY